jgi:uncharacterized protein YdcH (DUF465 family)
MTAILTILSNQTRITTMIEKHDLLHEFPEYREQIHTLKMQDRHFAKLFEEYSDVDHEVHGIESGDEYVNEDYLEERKKKRLHLKDELYKMLKAHSN